MNFHQSLNERSILTQDIGKQPQTSVESVQKAHKGSTKYGHYGSYVHKSGNIFWASWKFRFYAIFFKLSMVSYKTIHKAFQTHTTLYTDQLEKYFCFTIFHNVTLALAFKPWFAYIQCVPIKRKPVLSVRYLHCHARLKQTVCFIIKSIFSSFIWYQTHNDISMHEWKGTI